MAFRGEMNHRVDVIIGEDLFDEGAVGDIALDELVADGSAYATEPCVDICKTLRISRIGERIEVDDAAGEVGPGQ